MTQNTLSNLLLWKECIYVYTGRPILIKCTTRTLLEKIPAPKYNPTPTAKESPTPKTKLICSVRVAATSTFS